MSRNCWIAATAWSAWTISPSTGRKHRYDDHRDYRFVEGDARDAGLLTELLDGCDHFIAGAAMIGGISYFHAYAYDLLAANERITAASCDAALRAHQAGTLQKMTYLSSSMVYESTGHWPSKEGDERQIPPPLSSYGFQKLAVEYYARAAWDQFQLPYMIVRPFNCVGVGEGRASARSRCCPATSGWPCPTRCPTWCRRCSRARTRCASWAWATRSGTTPTAATWPEGIVTTLTHPGAVNEDFNLSTAESTSVTELAGLIWRKIKGPHAPLRLQSDQPYAYDVQKRVPDVEKARKVLGFEATTTLDDMLDEVIPWIEQAVRERRL